MTFLTFIKNSKSYLNSDKFKWLIFGNESSDLDSVVGSLVYAYFKQHKIGDNFVVIPVCCMSKESIKLKKDVYQWLSSFGIDSDNDLIHLDDVNQLIKSAEICLLDHHKPQLPSMAKHVREVIDHRQLVYHYPESQLTVNNVQLVGSCCTLIATYVIEHESLVDRSLLLTMLRGVILLDTDCLQTNNGKTTAMDVYTVEIIEACLGLDSHTRDNVYQSLLQAKSDVAGLSLTMMAQRDLKILELTWNNSSLRMAIPTLISVDVEDLLAITNLDIQLTDILKDLQVDIIIGLTCGTESRHRRGYLIFSNNSELNNKIALYMLLKENQLELQPLVVEKKLKAYYQNDLKTSRKLFIPIVERFFKIENEKQLGAQINNCNLEVCHGIQLTVKTYDSDFGADIEEIVESEGGPYSLNTPLRSYSGSPDNRNSDISLPSLNNRYTSLLVDKKRKKHYAEMDEEAHVYEEVHDSEKNNNDDISPRTFTPENTDDESDSNNDSIEDILSPLPSLQHHVSADKIKSKIENPSEQTIELISTPGTLLTNEINTSTVEICETKQRKLSNSKKEEINDTEFHSLAEKVNRKREKLHSSHIASIAGTLVDDVLNGTETMIVDELNAELMLSDWSESYIEDERKEIISCLNSNDLTKLAELLTNSLIRDCLKSFEIEPTANDVDANNSATEVDIDEPNAHSSTVNFTEIDESNSSDSPESLELNTEMNINDCHLGNIINEEHKNLLSSCVNSSSADVVENSSFNLYRRISNNQLDFSDDEKELLTTAGDWQPKDDIIYSDTEHEEHNVNHYSAPIDSTNNEVSKKVIYPDKEIYLDTSHFDMNTSTEISLNDLDNMPTPDIGIIDELEATENVESLSQTSSNQNYVEAMGDNQHELGNCSVAVNDLDNINFERYEVAINDAGYYFDATNNDERTKLITLSSCDFPDKSDVNYQAIMQHILDYSVRYLESVDCEYYTMVYFHCFGNQQKGPSLYWLHQSYQLVTYRLKKNLKHLYIVHPTIWVKAALFFSRFFIKSKFYSKIQYITDLESLGHHIPTSNIHFPPNVLK